MPAVGIDLGTSYSCVGVWVNDRVQIIPNDHGNRTTPSYIGFSSDERLVGDAAKSNATMDPQNIVFNAKRLIGRKFGDPEVQTDVKHFPFKVINKSGKPYIQVTYCGKEREFSPEEILSMVLIAMKENAEAYLGTSITDAVIAVPACFNMSKRQATRDAATIAGLNTLRIYTDSTAAAIAYALEKRSIDERTVLVFDLGAGHVSVSILILEEGILEVKATAGDTHLGGDDFDLRIVNFLVQEIMRIHKHNISSNPRALRRLRTACERAKRTLSSVTRTEIEIESLHQELCEDLFQNTLRPIEKVLHDSGIDKSNVHEIVLVGGSTRIPNIVRLVSEFFNGKEVLSDINPHEAVAIGAAIGAAIVTGDVSEKTKDFLLLEAVPFSLGIETPGGVFASLVSRNTTIPTKKFEILSDRQLSFPIKIYEGESFSTRDNNLLGESDILPFPHDPRIKITFDVMSDVILTVTASDETSGRSERIPITCKNDCLSKEEVERMVQEAQSYKSKNDLRSYAYNLKTLMDVELANKFDLADKTRLKFAADEIILWLDMLHLAPKNEYKSKQKELEQDANPIVQKFYSHLVESFSRAVNILTSVDAVNAPSPSV